jgi:serine/threonine-protein kinase
LACLQRDPALLAFADRWLSRAVREREADQAFEVGGYTPETTGRRSPYHRESGIACVSALVSQAQGDHPRLRRAVREFMAESDPPDAALDLTTGRTGTLLGAILLLEMLPGEEREVREELLEFGHLTAKAVWDRTRSFGPVEEDDQLTSTGMAHGWAGVVYGQLRWCQTTGSAVPPELELRLEQLARLAEPTGRGMRWPWTVGQGGDGPRTMPGWCNGSAGFVHLWALAHRLLDRQAYLELASSAGWDVFDDASPVTSLCCGLTGRAYALLALYRHTGDIQWRDRAVVLAGRAFARRTELDHELAAQSLYKGVVGMALLAADLAHPEGAAMPFFESEGWPSHGA